MSVTDAEEEDGATSLTKQMIQDGFQLFGCPRIAIDWIESTIPKGDAVLEFGSGEGSINLAQHYELTWLRTMRAGSAMQKFHVSLCPHRSQQCFRAARRRWLV